MKKKGDRRDERLGAMQALHSKADRLREECMATTTGRTDRDGFPVPVSGPTEGKMNYLFTFYTVTGANTNRIRAEHGAKAADNAHRIIAEKLPTGKISPAQRADFINRDLETYIESAHKEELYRGYIKAVDGQDIETKKNEFCITIKLPVSEGWGGYTIEVLPIIK